LDDGPDTAIAFVTLNLLLSASISEDAKLDFSIGS
jgi:hypothetical protein